MSADKTSAYGFEFGDRLEHFSQARRDQIGHRGAGMRAGLDQAHRREFAQRLAYGRARHLETARQANLVEARAGFEPARQNVVSQDLAHPIDPRRLHVLIPLRRMAPSRSRCMPRSPVKRLAVATAVPPGQDASENDTSDGKAAADRGHYGRVRRNLWHPGARIVARSRRRDASCLVPGGGDHGRARDKIRSGRCPRPGRRGARPQQCRRVDRERFVPDRRHADRAVLGADHVGDRDRRHRRRS